MSREAVHLIAHGRVQGVGFRFFVRDKASKYGVTGWVRNRPDGTVEAHAEGGRAALKRFTEEIRSGPTFGHVSELETDWIKPTEKYESFNIAF